MFHSRIRRVSSLDFPLSLPKIRNVHIQLGLHKNLTCMGCSFPHLYRKQVCESFCPACVSCLCCTMLDIHIPHTSLNPDSLFSFLMFFLVLSPSTKQPCLFIRNVASFSSPRDNQMYRYSFMCKKAINAL